MSKTVFFAACCLLFTLSALADDQWNQTFETKGAPDVVLRSNDSHIRVTAGSQSAVSARLIVKGFRPGEYEVRPLQRGDRVEIEVRVLPGQNELRWESRSLELEVSMPSRGNLDVRTDDGHVSVAGIAGQVRAHTGDGHIKVNGTDGPLDVDTNDGHINISDARGSLRGRSGDGHMSIQGRFNSLDLETRDGHLTVRVEDGSTMTEDWHLQTGDGRLELNLPRAFSAELDASTGDGRVQTDISGATQVQTGKDAHSYRARLGAGGKSLTLHTGDGGISIHQR